MTLALPSLSRRQTLPNALRAAVSVLLCHTFRKPEPLGMSVSELEIQSYWLIGGVVVKISDRKNITSCLLKRPFT